MTETWSPWWEQEFKRPRVETFGMLDDDEINTVEDVFTDMIARSGAPGVVCCGNQVPAVLYPGYAWHEVTDHPDGSVDISVVLVTDKGKLRARPTAMSEAFIDGLGASGVRARYETLTHYDARFSTLRLGFKGHRGRS